MSLTLNIEGNMPVITDVLPWERELLLPIVTKLLDEVLRSDHGAGEDDHEETAKDEED
jgi:hypothetical protein